MEYNRHCERIAIITLIELLYPDVVEILNTETKYFNTLLEKYCNEIHDQSDLWQDREDAPKEGS